MDESMRPRRRRWIRALVAGLAALAALVAGAVTYPVAHAAAVPEVDLGVEVIEFRQAAPGSNFYLIGARVTNHGSAPICCGVQRYSIVFTLTRNAVFGPGTIDPPRRELSFGGPAQMDAVPPNNFQVHRSSLTIIDPSVRGFWIVTVIQAVGSHDPDASDPNGNNVVRFELPVVS